MEFSIFNKQTPGDFFINKKSWIFLILSGVATGISWICYYKALNLYDVSKVVPVNKLSLIFTVILASIFLHENISIKSLIGCIIVIVGTIMMII